MIFGSQPSIIHGTVRASRLISKQGYSYKDILKWISVEHGNQQIDLMFCGYQPSITHAFMDIHAWTCYGFSIQGSISIKLEEWFPM